jgi:hypothetical protein
MKNDESKGRIYISGAFTTVTRGACGGGTAWRDNDPHFWSSPPTWGICRTDVRKVIKKGDYVFFVLPKRAEHPQMIYGYFRVRDKITHEAAFARFRRKRMRSERRRGVANGNIIVNARGDYNRYDDGVHRDRFKRIKEYYVIGDRSDCEFLTAERICQLHGRFVGKLNRVFDTNGQTVIDIIGRGGRKMTWRQVRALLDWLS